MNKTKQVKISGVAIAALVAFAVACGDEKKEEKLENPTAATTNLKKVKENFVPGSLAVTSSSGLALTSTGNFFDKQPEFLRGYLNIGQSMVNLTAEIVPHIAGFVADKKVGDKGEQELNADGITKIAYNVISKTSYKANVYTAKGAFVFLHVSKNDEGKDQYQIIIDAENDANRAADSKDIKKVQADVTYTSETEFTIDLTMTGAACTSTKEKEPSDFNILINRTGNDWKGKATILFPRWNVVTPTCDTTPTAGTRLFMYTDFVGNKDNATGSVYMANEDLTSKDNFNAYSVDKMCDNVSANCTNDGKFDGVNPTSYLNSFCAAATGAPTWSTACTDLGTAKYVPAAKWILPADLLTKISDLAGKSLADSL